MPYIQRNSSGDIVSLTQSADDNHSEYLSPTDKELIIFLTDESGEHETHLSKTTLSESDLEFARVGEDLINLLVKNNIILFTDLPAPVQEKMVAREKLRSHLGGTHTHSFLDNSKLI